MSAILVSYDLKSPGQKYTKLHEKLESFPNWAHPLESTWIVKGVNLTPKSVYDVVRPVLDDNDNILAIDISGDTNYGWLTQEIWDWINTNV